MKREEEGPRALLTQPTRDARSFMPPPLTSDGQIIVSESSQVDSNVDSNFANKP